MNEYNILSKRLKELLEKNNMSQRELAEKTDITEVTISRYVSAQRIPKATEIVKIADALNCTCDYLLGKEDKSMNGMIKTVRCHYNFLADYCNQIGRKHIISITSCFGEQHGEHFFTLIYDTPNLELKDC